ncbi:MAG: leucine-rich repeat domain-containing protein [Caldilineaceae bacterium]
MRLMQVSFARLLAALGLSLWLWGLSPTVLHAVPQAAMLRQSTVFDCSQVGEIPAAECRALVALYTNAGGPQWTNQTGWQSTLTPCSWFGVICAGGHVTELRLPANHLNGSVPTQIEDLTLLRVLDLTNNQLISLAPRVGKLANLQTLAVGGNQLTTVSSKLGQLLNLQVLDLSFNQLTRVPGEFSNLLNLQVLNLNNNQLSELPAELGNLLQLQRLGLQNNQLHAIPTELANLTQLRWLRLSNNALTQVPAELGHVKALEELFLDANQLQSLPPELGDLKNLHGLYLANNPVLSGPLPATLTNIQQLAVFWFDNTKLCEPGNAKFQSWLNAIPNLKRTGVICRYTYTASFWLTTPGQTFTVVGSAFTPNQTLTLVLNQFTLGSVQTNGDGGWAANLTTTQATPGFYVLAVTDQSEKAQLLLQTAPIAGSPTFDIPGGLGLTQFAWLPFSQK